LLFVVGRLKPGVTLQEAQAEMDAIAARVGQQYPEVKDWGIRLVTFTDTFVSPQLRTALLVLFGSVVFVLLIVSANVASLLLARTLDRSKEMAVRAALGAGRARLLRQVLLESVVLSVIGGDAGLLVATWGVSALESVLTPNLLPVPDIGVDHTVILFSLAVALGTGLVFGLTHPGGQLGERPARCGGEAGASTAEPDAAPIRHHHRRAQLGGQRRQPPTGGRLLQAHAGCRPGQIPLRGHRMQQRQFRSHQPQECYLGHS